MNARQEAVLKIIVESYIEKAEPVGSGFIASDFDLGVSPATVRNDMVLLENEGYIYQPHISAGRIPSEEGYRYYLASFLHTKPLPLTKKKFKDVISDNEDIERTLKCLATKLVELSGETAIVSVGPDRSYYVGLSNLFHKPDFQELELMQALSGSLDQFEHVMTEIFESVAEQPVVLIGHMNPFSGQMASLLVKYRLPNNNVGLIGLMGPMRMDYERNMQLLLAAHEVLDQMKT